MNKEEIRELINDIDFDRYSTKRHINELVEKVELKDLEEGSLIKILNTYLKLDIAYDELIDIIRKRILETNSKNV